MERILYLTPDEKSIIESIYGRQTEGYNPRKLEAIVELDANEEKFFTGKNFVLSHFFVQTLYKVRGNLSPIKFNRVVRDMLEENPTLRANFCNVGTRTLKVIKPLAAMNLEIIFRNITQLSPDEFDDEFTKIFEIDALRGIDLRHDPLIRFSVYRTGAEEFAILVTMAQVISENFNTEDFFCKLFDMLPELKPKENPNELPPKDYEVIRDYWSKVLEKSPSLSALPYEKHGVGSYRHRAFRKTIPADIYSDLRGHAQSNRMMLMAILQSAWGFLLQLTNKRRDCLFCQIASSEDLSLNVIPVRIIGENNSTVEQIVRKQFRQLIVSQAYSLSDWTVLDELTVQKKLFNHFVSFKEFTSDESKFGKYNETPASPFGKIVYQGSWNVQDMKLGLYFRYSEKNLFVNFTYDAGNFSDNNIEKIFKLYLLILQQMITDWNAKFSDFASRLSSRVEIQTEADTPPEDERKKLRDFISRLPILQGRFGGTIGLFDNQAEFVTLYEGDRISGDMLKKNFFFIADGLLSRNVDTGDGWYNTLDIIERNSFINPTSFLKKPRFTLSATVLTDQAKLLAIPHDVFIEVIRKTPEVALSVMDFALEQMERWQLIWLQS